MTELFTVWTPASLFGAIVGGLLLGMFVAEFDSHRLSIGRAMIAVFGGLSIFQIVFWASQFIDTLASSGEGLAWRVISRFLLSILYVAALSIGVGIGLRRGRKQH